MFVRDIERCEICVCDASLSRLMQISKFCVLEGNELKVYSIFQACLQKCEKIVVESLLR